MKKFAYFLFSLVFIANYSYAQGEVEALKYSRNELYGTARSMAMGNAFGALGGDITGVSINPAGIAVYRSSEVVGTLGFQQNTANVGDIDKKVNDFNLHNLGFVGYFPLRNDVMPMINFGFSYNKQKTFNNDINGVGNAATTNGNTFLKFCNTLLICNCSYMPVFSQFPHHLNIPRYMSCSFSWYLLHLSDM